MKTKIIFLCAVFLVTHAITYGQRTEVSVRKGKVLAQTATGSATIDAGRKAILTQGNVPVVTIDDPMVQDLLQMYEWIEAEKEAKRVQIDSTSIQIISLDNEKIWKGAGLNESPNKEAKPANVCTITGTMILNDPKYYDLEGNLLKFELEQISKLHCNYYLHFPTSVASGDTFKYIVVSEFNPSLGFWKDDLLWHHIMENNPRYCVNYFKVILPESAVFVNSSQEVVAVDNIDGRVAVTTRNYTGKSSRGLVHTTFLWPNKDGTSLKDLAMRFSGLGRSYEEQTEEATEAAKKLDSLPWDKAGDGVSQLYEEFVQEKVISSSSWFTLGIKLVGGRYWDQALVSFNHCGTLSYQKIDPDYVSSLIWQGHIYDVCEKREQAISKYEEALNFLDQFRNARIVPDFENYVFMRHDQWGIKLSYKWVKNRLEEPFTETMLLINAPTEEMVRLKERFDTLPWDGGGQAVLDFYKECVNNPEITGKSDFANGWLKLGIKLVGASYWDQAFDCFLRSERLSEKAEGLYYFTALIWQGHIYDIQGKREDALSKYEQASKIEKVDYMRHDQWGIVINYKWLKERLERPFAKEMIGK